MQEILGFANGHFWNVCLVFFLAGSVKGIIGLGFPTVVLGLLSVVIDMPTAMALSIVPAVAANVGQAFWGGRFGRALKRIWPFLVSMLIWVVIGSQILVALPLGFLPLVLGFLLILYSLLHFAGIEFRTNARYEPWLGVGIGCLTGVVNALTATCVVPGVMYLKSMDLDRTTLIQAMGILFFCAGTAMGLVLHKVAWLTPEVFKVSVLGILPAFAGLFAGQRIRNHLSHSQFQTVFFLGILIMGIVICVRVF